MVTRFSIFTLRKSLTKAAAYRLLATVQEGRFSQSSLCAQIDLSILGALQNAAKFKQESYDTHCAIHRPEVESWQQYFDDAKCGLRSNLDKPLMILIGHSMLERFKVNVPLLFNSVACFSCFNSKKTVSFDDLITGVDDFSALPECAEHPAECFLPIREQQSISNQRFTLPVHVSKSIVWLSTDLRTS